MSEALELLFARGPIPRSFKWPVFELNQDFRYNFQLSILHLFFSCATLVASGFRLRLTART